MIGRRVSGSFCRRTTAASGRPSRGEDEEDEGDGAVAKKFLRQWRKGAVKKRRGKGRGEGRVKHRAETDAKQKSEEQGYRHKISKPRFRDPLPMKMRALPQSFWQQPNLAPSSGPGGSVCALPPLPLPILLEKGSAEDQASKGISPGGDARHREEVVSTANTDLLFSLFRGVEKVAAEARRNQGYEGEEGRGGGMGGGGENSAPPSRPVPARRGRPRKTAAWDGSSTSAGGGVGAAGVRDDDPCLMSAVADSIRPFLPSQKDTAAGQQVLAMVTLPEVDGTVSLPTLDVQHNYSQILSKLVMKL